MEVDHAMEVELHTSCILLYRCWRELGVVKKDETVLHVTLKDID